MQRRTRRDHAACLLGLAIGVGGCVGLVDRDGSSKDGPIEPLGPREPGIASIPTCPEGADTVTVNPLRRLSRSELDQTLHDFLGARLHGEVELEVGAIPEDAAWAPEGLTPQSTAHVEALVAVATRVGEILTANPARWTDLGAGCMGDASADPACVDSFIQSFGLRAFRRPLTTAEASDARAFYQAASAHAEGAQQLVMRFLLAPQLVFHLEIEGEDDGALLALDDYAVANRLSYRILGTMPTDALFDAAAAGALSTEAQVETEVRRILEDDGARAQVVRFFHDWLRLDGLQPSPSHLGARYGFDPAELRDAMFEDVDRFVSHALWVDGSSYEGLLTSTNTFPIHPALASIYGVAEWSEGQAPVQAGPERAGLLTRAALLAHKDTRVAPIERGVFLRRRLLCDTLPSPDPEIVNSRLDELDSFDPLATTSREQIAIITSPDGCQTCHSLINGLAFPLEEYDALGRFRTEEEIYDEAGNLVASLPVDASATVVIQDGEEIQVSSAAELVDLLAVNEKVAACLARTVYEYTRRRPATQSDTCGVARLSEAVSAGSPLSEVFVRNAAERAVLYRRMEEN